LLIATIGSISEEVSGDLYYRTIQPMEWLGKIDGVDTTYCQINHSGVPALMRSADVVIVNMALTSGLLELVCQRRKQNQVTVYELGDEVADVPIDSPSDRMSEGGLDWLRWAMKAFDAVQFTVPELERRYGRYANRTAVFHNAVDPSMFTCARRRNDGRLVIGWGGSLGHRRDLEDIAPDLCRWINSKPDVTLSLMCHESLVQPFASIGDHITHRDPGDIGDYCKWLSAIDVGLAPLSSAEFNRCRSDVKFLEYSAAGCASIVRAMEPYRVSVQHGINGMLYNSHHGLLGALETLYCDHELRRTIAVKARQYALEVRRPSVVARDRLDFYRSLFPVAQVSRLSRDIANHGPDASSVKILAV
jgi:glycosyltransferase involved in cell wall biosynthesis